jgi:hypothetical protein
VACYAAIHGYDHTDPEELKALIRTAIERADGSRHSNAELEGYASNAYLDDLIRGALEKFGRRSRLISGIEPHYNQPDLTPEEAQARIRDTLAAFIAPLRFF